MAYRLILHTPLLPGHFTVPLILNKNTHKRLSKPARSSDHTKSKLFSCHTKILKHIFVHYLKTTASDTKKSKKGCITEKLKKNWISVILVIKLLNLQNSRQVTCRECQCRRREFYPRWPVARAPGGTGTAAVARKEK